MPLKNIPFKPGINLDVTDRMNGKEGFWKDGDKVRFYDGLPTKIGGWTRGQLDTTFLGVARGVKDWKSFDQAVYIAFGTHLKLYVWSGGTYYDITPFRTSGTLTNPFTTTISSAVVTVTDTSHGLYAGDYVHFSGASAVGGITISGEYTVTSITDSDNYTITHTSAASSSAGPGGGSVTYDYEVPVGREDTIVGLGWGAGSWSVGGWGTPRSATNFLSMARIWSVDNWGEDIVACYRDGSIYVWDTSAGTTNNRAAVISQAPITAKAVFVSPEDRHLIALGAHDGSTSNPLLIRWCDQENYTDWTPTVSNTAGDKQLDSGTEIYCGVKTRGERIIFTDTTAFSMTYVGPPDTFAFRSLGGNGGLAGPMAVAVFEGIVYWMGKKDFFMYDGLIKVLPCSVTTIFDTLNFEQRAKIYCGVNQEYREIWWLYPDDGSDECDRYVLFNTRDQSWAIGTLDRTMLVGDSAVLDYPYGFGTDGYMYTHEYGTDAFDQAMNAYIESGDVEVDADGNQLMHISKFVPDLRRMEGTLNLTVTGKKYPQATETQTSGPHAMTSSTEFVNPRVRCRQLSLKFESTGVGDDWRIGMPRVELVPHGRR